MRGKRRVPVDGKLTCTKCLQEKDAAEQFCKKHDRKEPRWESHCKDCRHATRRQWVKDNPGRYAASREKWLKTDRGRCAVTLAITKRNSRLGGYAEPTISLEDLVASLTGVCAICGVPEAECDRRLSLDHCHETGSFRGWLCGRCNFGIGLFGNSQVRLESAARYVSGVNGLPAHRKHVKLYE